MIEHSSLPVAGYRDQNDANVALVNANNRLNAQQQIRIIGNLMVLAAALEFQV